jgi:hypothetical protein
MAAATYVSVLTRSHLRSLAPLPKAEWLIFVALPHVILLPDASRVLLPVGAILLGGYASHGCTGESQGDLG